MVLQKKINQIRNPRLNDLLPGIFPFLRITVQWLGNILDDKWSLFIGRHFCTQSHAYKNVCIYNTTVFSNQIINVIDNEYNLI